MSTEQILDLIINYAYIGERKRSKNTKCYLDMNKIVLLDRLMMRKSWKLIVG